MSLDLDTVLRLLSINGYSLFSLIDDILARGEWEDRTIKLLQEGIERDAVDICARLLSHKPTNSSISEWALGAAQTMLPSEEPNIHRDSATYHPLSESLVRNNNVLSPGFSFGTTTWAPTDDPERVFRKAQFKNDKHGATVLPDNVFLEIFDFCLRDEDSTTVTEYSLERTKKWQTLAHVCQRWRRIIFASPRRLELHLTCSFGTPVRKNLVLWPVGLPLTVNYPGRLDPIYGFNLAPDNEDSIIFALEHARRVHRINILAKGSLLGKVSTVMEKSFPALTHLDLVCDHINPSTPFLAIPRRFLGGSAPRLQHLRLESISFPQFPTFLLSARNLHTLKLEEISEDGYIMPEAIVRSLAIMTKLTTVSISFSEETRSSPSEPWTSHHPDSPMRTILPVLTSFEYRGRSEYLEDFLAQIDIPRLDHLGIYYFAGQIQVPQLSQFVGRTENLKLDQFKRAEVTFFSHVAYLGLACPQRKHCQVQIYLSLWDEEWLYIQVSRFTHVLSQLVALFPKVAHFSAHGDHIQGSDMDSTEWLPFFRLFPAVKGLHLSGGVAAYIVSALEDADEEMATEVFPALYLIWVDESNDEDDEDEDDLSESRNEPVGSIEQFLSFRRLSGRPVTVVNTRDEFFKAYRKPRAI